MSLFWWVGRVPWIANTVVWTERVVLVACGQIHALIVVQCANDLENQSIQVWEKGVFEKIPRGIEEKVRVRKVACGIEGHFLWIDARGRAFGCGANEFGQVLPNLKFSFVPLNSFVQIESSCNSTRFVDVAAGQWHSLLSDDEGSVWSFGKNDFGQCGFSSSQNSDSLPNQMQSLFRVSLPVSENSADSATSASSQQTKNVIVCAGWNHSLFLLPSGKVAACGRGSAGALGLEDASEFVSPPRLISDLEDQKVTAIAAGLNHSLFLTDLGEVSGCGSNSHGQLGFEDGATRKSPSLIEALAGFTVIQIAAGSRHSAFWTREGGVFGTGSNQMGQVEIPIDCEEEGKENSFEERTKQRTPTSYSVDTSLLSNPKATLSCGTWCTLIHAADQSSVLL